MRNHLRDHLAVLRRYALVLTRDPTQAEDLVQDSLLRALAGEGSRDPGREVRPWLLSIVHNTHVSRRRRATLETAVAKDLEAVATATVPASQMARLELKRTIAALLELPEPQRVALVLVAMEGMSYRQAAEILDVPVGTLMSRLARGREALRAASENAEGRERSPTSDAAGASPALKRVK
jgi:RNA polymerase sigma-70 factor (ECF subfamily)